MKQTLMVKLDTSEEQHQALLETMHRFNEACNHIANIAFEKKTANKIELQKVVYYDVRERFGLSAQLVIRAIAKVSEAYKRDKSIKPEFRPDGAIVYDQRILSWRGLEAVSIISLNGRLKIPISIGEYQKARMDRVRGQADLIYRDGVFYLAVVVEAPEPSKFDAVGVLGVDLGIVNLAVDSDGETYSGSEVKKVRRRYVSLRARLQSAGTKSAKRHLRKVSKKESRFMRDVNHCISKRLVTKAKDTGRAVAREDLKGIRSQTTVRRAQRYYHSSWAFGQLGSFVGYKAVLMGVPDIIVNPRGTSHTCPICLCNDRRNRPSRDQFRCIQCGFAGPADHVAAINIEMRAAVNQPIVACSDVEAVMGIETEHSYKLLPFRAV